MLLIESRVKGNMNMTNNHLMKNGLLDLLKRLVETPSPSGYTGKVMELIAKELECIGVTYKKTNKGAVIATIEGEDTARHRLLTAHTDTLGAMVKED